MSLGHGSSIVRDGLVFYYDMDNKKSWKGKPTTNLLSSYTIDTWNGTASRAEDITILSETYNGGTVYRLQDATGVDPAIMVDNYLMANYFSTLTIGDIYTFSIDVRVVQKATTATGGASNAIWVWLGDNTTYIYTQDLPLNEWVRIECHATVNATYTALTPRIDYDNSIIDIANPQFEKNSFATPYNIETRSNTEAILDLTNKSIITPNTLTYNTDGTFSFSGNNTDYLSIPGTFDFSSEQTIEIWMKSTNSGTARRNPYNQAYGGYGTMTYETNNVINYYYGNGGGNAVPYTALGTNFTIAQDELICICVTRNTSTVTWYRNGEQRNSAPNAYGVLLADSNPIWIGDGYTSGFIGDIYAVKLYDRALTAPEVRQNFNALRWRFGI